MPKAPGAAPPTLALVVAVTLCAFAFAIDLSELALSNVLSAVFAAAPARLQGLPLSWLLSALYAGAILGAPLVGLIADHVSLRRVLGWVVLGLALTSLLTVVSASARSLAACRLLSGLALGAYPPLMVTYLTRLAPGRSGLLVFITSAAAYLAPPAVLFTVKALTPIAPLGLEAWRWPYAIAAAGCFVAGLAFRWAPASEAASAMGPDLASPQPRLSLFRFGLVSLLYFLIPWATVAFPLLTGPVLLARHVSLARTLTYVSLSTVGPAIAALLSGLVVDRVGRGLVMAVCAVVMALACMGFFFAHMAYALGAAVILFGLGSALFLPAMTLFGAEQFPRRLQGRGTTLAWAVNRLGAMIASMVLVPLGQANAAGQALLLIVGALLAIVALVVTLSRQAREYQAQPL